jgi:hypothetical protein
MSKFHTAAMMTVVMALAVGFAFEQARAAPLAGAETTEQAAPQGEDPPGADDDAQTPPPSEHNGVITPPPTGDEGIHADVPNPGAGHDEEVIPPSQLPGAAPNVEAK